jgi:hypothetical protein
VVFGEWVMEVKDDAYRVAYDDVTGTVLFEGMLRLRGSTEYSPISELLDEVARAAPEVVTLDLRELRFLNSAGIDLLLRFTLKMRKQATSQVIIRGAADIPWQGRTLPNFGRLMPELKLSME